MVVVFSKFKRHVNQEACRGTSYVNNVRHLLKQRETCEKAVHTAYLHCFRQRLANVPALLNNCFHAVLEHSAFILAILAENKEKKNKDSHEIAQKKNVALFCFSCISLVPDGIPTQVGTYLTQRFQVENLRIEIIDSCTIIQVQVSNLNLPSSFRCIRLIKYLPSPSYLPSQVYLPKLQSKPKAGKGLP